MGARALVWVARRESSVGLLPFARVGRSFSRCRYGAGRYGSAMAVGRASAIAAATVALARFFIQRRRRSRSFRVGNGFALIVARCDAVGEKSVGLARASG